MRKSLGEKRRFITEEQVAEITRLHGSLDESDVSKLIPVEQFGYRTITVDRPLRAHWEIGHNTWDGLVEDKTLAKLDADVRESVVAELTSTQRRVMQTEDGTKLILREILTSAGVPKPSAPLLKALVARCMVRDSEADAVRDAKGRLVPDPELRDAESVPLTEEVDQYLAREVLPFTPDAWVEDVAGRVGFEVPFTRLFYRYEHLRPSAELRADLQQREARIRQLLEEVLV